jgi:hypothetical protein
MANGEKKSPIQALTLARTNSKYSFSAVVSDECRTYAYHNDGITMLATVSAIATHSATVDNGAVEDSSYHCASASYEKYSVRFAVQNMKFITQLTRRDDGSLHMEMDLCMFPYTNGSRCYAKMYVTRWANILLEKVQKVVETSATQAVESKLLEVLMRSLHAICKPKEYYSTQGRSLEKEVLLLDYNAGVGLLETDQPKTCKVHCALEGMSELEGRDCIVLSKLFERGEIRSA